MLDFSYWIGRTVMTAAACMALALSFAVSSASAQSSAPSPYYGDCRQDVVMQYTDGFMLIKWCLNSHPAGNQWNPPYEMKQAISYQWPSGDVSYQFSVLHDCDNDDDVKDMPLDVQNAC